MKNFFYSTIVAILAVVLIGCNPNEPGKKDNGKAALSKLSYSQVECNGKVYNVKAEVIVNPQSGTQYVEVKGDGLEMIMDLGKCYTETTIDIANPKPNPEFKDGDPQFMMRAMLHEGEEYTDLFAIHTNWDDPSKLIIDYALSNAKFTSGSFTNQVKGDKYTYEGWLNFSDGNYVAFKLSSTAVAME